MDREKMTKIWAVLILLALFTLPAQAEDKKEESKAEETTADKKPEDKSFRFAPDFCDFEITFPEAPAVARKCVTEDECFDVQSYTMVYDLQTTVDVTVSCNPSTPAAYKKYTEPVMKAALTGMIRDRNLSTHEIGFRNYGENIKSASLTGTGVTGSQDKIYTGQLWIGPNSVFSIQAELIGSAHEVADKSFSDILRSVKTKDGKQLPKPTVYKNKGNQ
ncbi:MAG: hypothetical protein DI551_11050 [Micavibrio aeruginosavorus]|uniref:Uncharacterized protein n=1 Tax=Micavibrio aeruginosavorus TaxID=349221 RepID=A0A2W5MRS8_9BACT|nr:MAG: hypothetical protein DI551_11050 [Micavibrio aeruginosavorus]